jgi:hypothetical protein
VATLTLLVAGAVNTGSSANQGNTKTFPGAVTISTNGTMGNQMSYMLDGAPNMDTYTNVNQPFPFPDAVQEFSVQTSNYSTQYGMNAGGAVNIVTKSGTNQIHGDAFGFDRNAVFNARNFFSAKRDTLKRSQFGGTVGGPLVIPNVYNGKDRTFWFFGYQGTRHRNFSGGHSGVIPTISEVQNGDFSALLDANSPDNPLGRSIQIINPVTLQPYAGNMIPTTSYDPAALGVMKYLPSAGGNGVVFYSIPDVQNFNEYVGRLDHEFTPRDHLTGRAHYDFFTHVPVYEAGNILAYTSGSSISSENYMLHYSHIFSPSFLGDFHFSIARSYSVRGNDPRWPSVQDFGVQGVYQPQPIHIDGVSASGFFSFGGFGPGYFHRTDIAENIDLKWVKGRHTFAFGGSVTASRNGFDVGFQSAGGFTFTSDITNYALASFLLGKLQFFRQGGEDRQEQRNTFSAVYFNDIFRFSRRLSFNYGLRYEPYTPWLEIVGRGEVFLPQNYYDGVTSQVYVNAPPGLLFKGDSGVSKYFTTGDYNNFMPRAGFAWDVFGNGKTSVRGGGGLFYNTRIGAIQVNRQTFVTPYAPQVTITYPEGPFSNPYLGVTNPGIPAPFVPPRDSLFVPPVLALTFNPTQKYLVPLTYDFNLTFEQQLAHHWLLRLAYVGSHGTHYPESVNWNPAVYIPGSTLGTDQRRIFQGYSNVILNSPEINQNYNSGQVTLSKRFSQGFTILANYTYSKSLDTQPSGADAVTWGAESFSPMPYYDPNRRAFDYGPSNYDHTHVFTLSYVWELPKLSSSAMLVRGFLGNWQLSGIVSAHSGDPLTILAGTDQSKTGLGTDRAVIVGPAMGSGACKNTTPCVDYLNPNSFDAPAIGTYGNVGKGSLRGPKYVDADMGFFKNFPIGKGERYRLQLRMEYFNIFNHTNLGNPTNSYSSGVFGAIRSANDPRIGQVAIKVFF